MSRFGDQFAARLGRGITRAWPDGASGWAQKVDKPLRRSHFARAADAARQPSISPFASPGGFVIRSGVADPVRMFLGSSAVEHSTVNRMVAGSNPARGAKRLFQASPASFQPLLIKIAVILENEGFLAIRRSGRSPSTDDVTRQRLSPHPAHAGADVDARALACGSRRGTRRRKRPCGFLEQSEQSLRNEARPRGVDMPVALRMLAVGEEALRYN